MINRKNKFYIILTFVALLALSLCMAVSLNVNITDAKADTDNTFAMVDGAEIRTVEPYGIRFKAAIGNSKYKEILSNEDGVSKEVGMFIFPASYIENANAFNGGEADKLAGKFANLKQKLKVVFYDSNNPSNNSIYYKDEMYYVNGVVKDLYLENYDRQFVGVAYISETVGSNTTYEYATLNSDYATGNARSAAQIAYLAYQDGMTDVMEGYMIGDYLLNKGVTQTKVDDTLKFVYGNVQYDSQEDVEEALGVNYSIELNKTSSLLIENKKETLSVKFSNEDASDLYLNKYIGWESSEDAVATVDDGEVSAVKLGKTTVKAALFGMENSCEVTVSNLQGNTKLLNDFEQPDSVIFFPDQGSATRFKTYEDSTEKARSGNSSYKIVSTPSSNNDAADFVYFTIKGHKLKANDVISFWVYVDSLDSKVSTWTQVLHSAALSPLSDGTSGTSIEWLADGYLKVGKWSYVSYKLTADDIFVRDGHAWDGAVKLKTNSWLWYDGMSKQDVGAKSITFYIDDIYLNEYDDNKNAFIYDTEQMSYYGGETRRAGGPCSISTSIYYADSIDMDNSAIDKTVYGSSLTNVTNPNLGETYANQTGDSKYDTCPFTLLNVAEYTDGNYFACRPMMQPFDNKTKTQLAGYTIEFWVYCKDNDADIIALERSETPFAVWTAYLDNIYHVKANEWTKISYTYADSNIIGLNIGTFTGNCHYYIDGVVIRG